MPITLNGDTGITTPSYGGTDAAEYLVPVTAFKNRIINGAMMIDQRNAGASGTGNASYTVDRWAYFGSQTLKVTWQQNAGSVTPPVGFRNYLGFTSSSAYSVLTSDEFDIYQSVEGFNIADLAWGTASASPITISFWVRSSLTGTFGGSLRNAGAVRSYPFSYTISASNTWEQKTITIAGDTTGTWSSTNTTGIQLIFSLGAGSSRSGTAGSWATADFVSATGATSVVGTSGATFYITGVQLEKGSTATSFDYRPYGTELALCQRYFQVLKSSWAVGTSTTAISGILPFYQELRAAPTLGKINNNIKFGDRVAVGNGSSSTPTINTDDSVSREKQIGFNLGGFSGFTTRNMYIQEVDSTNTGLFTVSAEL